MHGKLVKAFCWFFLLLIAFLIGLLVSIPLRAEPVGAFDQAVTQENIKETICVKGYTDKVRPSSHQVRKIKLQIIGHGADTSLYELDHFIPLSIGGSPRSLDNLWVQTWEGTCNARDKDRLEIALHKSVCRGAITLKEAQRSVIYWRKTYRQYFGKHC